MEKTFSRIEILNRWEETREIKNLMGRFAMALFHKQDRDIVSAFWSAQDSICYGVNEGWYEGKDAVRAYFWARADYTDLADRVLKERFPSLTGRYSEEQRGLGSMDVKSLSTDLVVLAEDGATAKGMWLCAGQEVDYSMCGPVSMWTFGVFAADFLRESQGWKFWHLQYLEEIRSPQGETWWETHEARPTLPEFASLAGFSFPKPNRPERLFVPYSPERGPARYPLPPEPYVTFSDTFSYGPGEENAI